MPNTSGEVYGLTALCPLKPSGLEGSTVGLTQARLDATKTDEDSPMAGVPNTYLCRFFVLEDVVYEGKPAREEHLKSQYLVFSSNFHGDLDTYLQGMWQHAEAFVRNIWAYCRTFESVSSAQDFVAYIKRCQVKTTFLFNGSTDEPLAEQLKGLYLKQEFSKFACDHQGLEASELQVAFNKFVQRVKPFELSGPTWRPGASTLAGAVTEGA